MIFREILPQEKLRPYVRCYWLMDSEGHIEVNDTLLPNGYMEIVFNLGNAVWESAGKGKFSVNPPIELVGQMTKPQMVKCSGHNILLGIRFHTHAAALFLNESMHLFNDGVEDLSAVLGSDTDALLQALLNMPSLSQQIALIELFLLNRLMLNERKTPIVDMLGHAVSVIQKDPSDQCVQQLATQCGISPRYLQKLFVAHLGVSPSLFLKISRFKKSLAYLNGDPGSLTAIAYNCGYFDQSHFIRDFKSFTGMTPSSYSPELFPVSQYFS